MDPHWDDRGDLVDITREKFTETGEASEPDLIVPVCPLYNVAACPQFTLGGNTGICATAKSWPKTIWNSWWECWLPEFTWRRVLEGLMRRRGCL